MKGGQRAPFPLKNHPKLAHSGAVLRALVQGILHRPLYRLGTIEGRPGRRSTLRNAQFVSFMVGQGLRRSRRIDAHEARLFRQRLLRSAAALLLGAGLLWLGFESARALTMF
jgi:hypothetical protein